MQKFCDVRALKKVQDARFNCSFTTFDPRFCLLDGSTSGLRFELCRSTRRRACFPDMKGRAPGTIPRPVRGQIASGTARAVAARETGDMAFIASGPR